MIKNKKTNFWILFASINLSLLVILLSLKPDFWIYFWGKLINIPMIPPFADSQIINYANKSLLNGYDPVVNNIFDPWNRNYVYTDTWSSLFFFLNLEKKINFLIFIFFLIFLYLYSILRITFIEFFKFRFLLLPFIFSGINFLTIERGHTDMLIFILLTIALLYRKISLLLIFLVSYLKIYPFVAFIAFVNNYKLLFLYLTSCVFAFFLVGYDQIFYISQNTQEFGNILSFGLKSISKSYFNLIEFNSALENFYLNYLFSVKFLLPLNLFILLIMVYYHFRKNYETKYHHNQDKEFILYENFFLVGSYIYIFLYLFTSSTDLKFIYLIFTIPYLISNKSRLKILFYVSLIILVNTPLLHISTSLNDTNHYYIFIAIIIYALKYLIFLFFSYFSIKIFIERLISR